MRYGNSLADGGCAYLLAINKTSKKLPASTSSNVAARCVAISSSAFFLLAATMLQWVRLGASMDSMFTG